MYVCILALFIFNIFTLYTGSLHQPSLLKTYPSSKMTSGLGLTGSTMRLPIPQQQHTHNSSHGNANARPPRKPKAPVVLQSLEEGESTFSIDDSNTYTQAYKGKD